MTLLKKKTADFCTFMTVSSSISSTSTSTSKAKDQGKEKDPKRQSNRALAALLLGGCLIGCSPIFVRLSEVQSVSTAFWRLALALVPLSLVSWRERSRDGAVGTAQPGKPRGVREIATVALPGVLLGTELSVWHISLHLTSVANSTLLVNMAPIFVALYSWLFQGRTPSRLLVLALALTIGGVIILKGGFSAGSGSGSGAWQGDLTAMLSAVLYASYILAVERARARFSASSIMMWGTSAAALCVLPAALLSEPTLLPQTWVGWAVLIGVAWLAQAAGQGLITFSLAWLPATFSSLTLLLQPVVAAILAWLLLHEPLTPWQIVGGLIVITGIWTARLAQRR